MKKLIKIFADFSKQTKQDNLNSYASSCAFFIFLSIVPIVMLLFAILPYTPIDSDIIIEWFETELPAGTGVYIVSILESVTESSIGLISITAITALWAAGKGVNSLMAGFNAIDKNVDRRNWVVLRLISSFYTLLFLASVIILLVLMVGGNALLNLVLGVFPKLSVVFEKLVNFRSLISIVLMTLLFTICFALLPCKKHKLKETFPGAVMAALAWTGFSFLFSFYVDKFNAFSMYGSLTTIIVLLFWLYTCMYILLLGFNINRYFRPVIKTLMTKGTKISDIKGQLESLEE